MLKRAYLEITNVCNLSCAFCPGTKRAPRFMTEEEFRIYTAKLRGKTQYLYLHLMGEPLLHPLLGRFLEIAGENSLPVILTTNGTLLREKGEILCAAKSLHKVSLSLQSFEANAGGELEAYLCDCTDFVKKAADAGIICELRLWNLGGLERRNGEIEAFLEREFPKPWAKGRGGWKLREDVWLEPGRHFDWPELSAEDRGEACFCYGLRDQVGILSDGTVVPCCLDHDGDVPLGNLMEQELDEILASERARAIYEGFSRRTAVEPLCRRCGFARQF